MFLDTCVLPGCNTRFRGLVSIMNMGNELYSMLSTFSRQQYLLLSEIPTMVSVDDNDYSLELSESYIDDLHLHHDIIENIAYVMPFDVALEELQNENFKMFLLTIEYNTMSIFLNNNGFLELFDSHSRDLCCMPTPHGSCLLEFESIIKLTKHPRIFVQTWCCI